MLNHRQAGAMLALLATLGSPAAAQTLTGATVFSTDSAGGAAGGQIWNTRGSDVNYDLWLAQAGTFVNGPADTQAGISIPLAPGTYTYALYGEPFDPVSFDGLNLFFDGDVVNPGISAFGPTQTTSSPSSFAAAPLSTIALDGSFTPGAGTLTYTNGNTVTLTGFTWADPSVNNADLISPYEITPSGKPDFVGSFTLEVRGAQAAVPEPGSLALLALGLVPLAGVVARRRRA